MRVMRISFVVGTLEMVPGRVGSRMNQEHPNYGIVEKSPGNLRRLAATQTPVKNHQLMVVEKTHIIIIIIIITEDSVDASIQRLEDYTEKHKGGLITAIKNNTDNMVTNRMTITRKQKWGEINHIISECSKLAQKEYKTRHNWVSKVIHWEMCKKFKLDNMNKWYVHNPAAVPENDTHKLLWNFDIQTDHLISARRPDLIVINKQKRELAKLLTLLSRLTTE